MTKSLVRKVTIHPLCRVMLLTQEGRDAGANGRAIHMSFIPCVIVTLGSVLPCIERVQANKRLARIISQQKSGG